MPSLPVSPRKLVVGSLGLAAKGLQIGAFAARAVAEKLAQDADGQRQPDSRDGGGAARREPAPVAETRMSVPPADEMERGAVLQPPTDPVPMVDTHARTFETHAAELAERSAGDVIDALSDMSTDDLRLLYEHEQANKKRKTVLKAIEAQLAPVG